MPKAIAKKLSRTNKRSRLTEGGDRVVRRTTKLHSSGDANAAANNVGTSIGDDFGAIYGLTPSEMRVLRAFVEVGGIADIAVALAVSPTTVKTHLRHIFQKTGTKGQVDLIRLIARAPSSSET